MPVREDWEGDGYPLRLTNLMNATGATDVQAPPDWEGMPLGGLFKNGQEVDPEDYSTQWGYEGCSSDAVVLTAGDGLISGNPWDFLYSDEDEVFRFLTFLNGQEVEIDQPLMMDFDALGEDAVIAYTRNEDSQPFAGGKRYSELRVFIPFAREAGGSILPYQVRIDGRLILTSRYVYSSRNCSGPEYPHLDDGDWDNPDDPPGVCLIFYPIGTDTPHDITPGEAKMTMVGGPQSSYRNKGVELYNDESWKHHLPYTDWGYHGYFFARKSECFESLSPALNSECKCIGGYDQILGFNDEAAFIMSCSGMGDGEVPYRLHPDYEPFLFRRHRLFMDGVEVDFSQLNTETTNVMGTDLSYALSYAVKNPDFTSTRIMNWTTGHAFDLTHEIIE